MRNEWKQLKIIENQLSKALVIVLQQRKRFEELQSQLYSYTRTCEEADKINEIANGLQGALGNIECVIENIYK